MVLGKIVEFYSRDSGAKSVDRALFLELVNQAITNPKHQSKFAGIIDEAFSLESSVPNLEEMIIGTKRNEVAGKLSIALANQSSKVDELIEEYNELKAVSSIEELGAKKLEVYSFADMESIIDDITNGKGTLKLYPLALDRKIDSGLRGGHHIIIFAPPEVGKTALAITIANGFARQGAEGIYFGNEDPLKSLSFRGLSCSSGMTKHAIELEPRKALAKAKQNGFDNISWVPLEPGTTKEIESLVEKKKAKWIIVDQAINLESKGDGKTAQLGETVKNLRNIGKRHDLVVVSLTQAGASAQGKNVLEQTDVYMSMTEVPAAADLMIGIGGDSNTMAQGHRILSLPKNKISGRHEHVAVRVNPLLSRYQSLDNSET